MLALPPAPAAPPSRQLFVGTAVACIAGFTLLGGMCAMFLRFRDAAMAKGTWVPNGIIIPEVPSNMMLLSFIATGIFAQWAVYAARRNDKQHVAMALGLTGLIGLAVVNAQAAVYAQMKLPIHGENGSAYGIMFYAITGTFAVLMIIGIIFSIVCAFRFLGGRTNDREIVTAHALYWYFLAAAFSMLWFVVYVTK